MSFKFECQETCKGQCCKPGWTGSNFIFLTEDDTTKIELHTGFDRKQFSKIGEFDWTRFSKKKIETRYMSNCQFLKDGRCGIYEARPVQCRTFPYWPENLNAKKWSELKKECPGIDMGPIKQDDEQNQIASEAEQRRADTQYGKE